MKIEQSIKQSVKKLGNLIVKLVLDPGLPKKETKKHLAQLKEVNPSMYEYVMKEVEGAKVSS